MPRSPYLRRHGPAQEHEQETRSHSLRPSSVGWGAGFRQLSFALVHPPPWTHLLEVRVLFLRCRETWPSRARLPLGEGRSWASTAVRATVVSTEIAWPIAIILSSPRAERSNHDEQHDGNLDDQECTSAADSHGHGHDIGYKRA